MALVDAANLVRHYSSTEFLRETGESLGANDERTLVDLLVDQIEFANVIVLNKLDLIDATELATVRSIIRSLNARAEIIETTLGQIDLDRVLDTGLFHLEEAQDHPLWAQELYNFKHHVPETEEYGIVSFVYRAREPFDPEKIHAFFNESWPGVVRAKGFFWLATRPDLVGDLSQAGAVVRHQGLGRWWAAVPKAAWPNDKDFRNTLRMNWQANYGDRRQEIVFIGLKGQMDESLISKRLDDCLVRNYLDNSNPAKPFIDPFPPWFSKASAESQ